MSLEPPFFADAELALADIRQRLDALESSQGPPDAPGSQETYFATPEAYWDLNPPEDGTEDESDYRALHWCLSHRHHSLPVMLREWYDTHRTIDTGQRHGLAVAISGRTINPKANQGATSLIRWAGKDWSEIPSGVADRSIWRYKGQGILGHLPTLWGRSESGNRAKVGFLSMRQGDGGGMNPNKSAIDSMCVVDCERGIQLGERGENGCDNLNVGVYHCRDCDVGIYLNTPQSMDHSWGKIWANDVDRIIHVHSGGRFNATNVTAIERVKSVLHLGAGSIGGNNNSFGLDHVWVDSPANEAAIVTMDRSIDPGVIIEIGQVEIAQPQQVVVYDVYAPCRLSVRAHDYLRPGAFMTRSGGANKLANIELTGCYLGRDVPKQGLRSIMAEGATDYRVTMRGCFSEHYQPVPDCVITPDKIQYFTLSDDDDD